MKKIFCFALMLLLCLSSLTACFGGTGFSGIYDTKDMSVFPAYTDAQMLSVSGDLKQSCGDLYLFENTSGEYTAYTVYDLEKNTQVMSWSDTENSKTIHVTMIEAEKEVFFSVSVKAEENTTTKLYSAKGQELISADDKKIPTTVADLVCFDGDYYGIDEEKGLKEVFNDQPLAQAPQGITHWREDYYYQITAKSALVYDKKGNLLCTYTLPSFAIEGNIFLLENGKLLVQYEKSLPISSEDYDLSGEMMDAYDLVTLIVNPKNGSTKNIESDYIYVSVTPVSVIEKDKGIDYLSKDIQNVALATPVLDKKPNEGKSNMVLLSVGNDGQAKEQLNTAVMAQTTDYAVQVSQKRFVVADQTGEKYLLDQKGKVIGKVGSAIGITSLYVVGEDAIYDHNLKMVYDLDENDFTVEAVRGETILLSKEENDKTAYYTYYNGYHAISTAEEEAEVVVQGDGYLFLCKTVEDKQRNFLYGIDGKCLLGNKKGTIACQGMTKEKDVLLFSVAGSSSNTYYRISYVQK